MENENDFIQYDYNSSAPSKEAGTFSTLPDTTEGGGKSGKRSFGRVLLILLLALAVSGGSFYIGNQVVDRIRFSADDSTEESEDGPGSEESIPDNTPDPSSDTKDYPWTVPSVIKELDGLTYIQIAKKACPSVVEIDTETITTGFWNQEYITAGAGSGVIISNDGYVLTNNHVIEDTTHIIVRLTTGEEYEAKLIGLDETLDIALLKIEADGLIPAEIGTSANLLVGQEVVAIGNPMGKLGGTVTNGIVSAVNRKLTMSNSKVMSLIQTNAAINPGNSGGGLFDAAGRLIGIVNAKMADEEIEGLGFAIPIDDVLAILNDLYDYGYVKTGQVSLGLTMVDINSAAKAWQYGVSSLGLYIYDVEAGSSAETAGLRSGDRIVAVNQTAVSSSQELEALMGSLSVGDTFEITVARRGTETTVIVICEEYIPAAIKAARYNP